MPNPVPPALNRPFLWLIRGYQRFVSPLFPPACRYYPSCSRYAAEALRRKSLGRALVMIAWRLMRCNPLSRGGYDPVEPDDVTAPSNPSTISDCSDLPGTTEDKSDQSECCLQNPVSADTIHSEILRQGVHLSLGAGALLLAWVPAWAMIGLLAVAAAIVASAGHLVRHPDKYPNLALPLLRIFRPTESRWNNGGMFYLAGVAIAIMILPWPNAMAGWLILAGGDSVANIVGQRFPIHRFGRKSLGGLLGFIAGALILWPLGHCLFQISLLRYFVASAITSLGETFLPAINDNLWIAPVSGALSLILPGVI